ncbi:cytochrome c oxidase, cbb3-type, CcoQ subunit [Nitrosophilus alvini]|uniref:cytochrome c oxidase, cbb3-type, CcoQ subunit n=1 Tax=Nitrosophilus alvini TaxID=2714855 RepID=UPI00190B3BA7|nr:cytochrome c oxidase, cbb3-type, CcoQ subunit [Nitrosophilus alvini]
MDLREIQAYAYFFFVVFLTLVLYGYIVHLYRSEKKGLRDYEKYGKIALDDEPGSPPVEEIKSDEKANDKKEQ